jgi:hypothetical protein
MMDASRTDRARPGLLQAGRAWGLVLLILALWPSGARASGEDDGHDDGHHHHRHHIAVAGGAAFKDSGKNAGFLGADYVYNISPSFGAGVAYEETFGDFNLQAFFLSVGVRPGGGPLKLGLGVGVERKLAGGQNKGIVFLSAGYDFHVGRLTLGPEANIDFVEGGARVYSLGLAVGVGF